MHKCDEKNLKWRGYVLPDIIQDFMISNEASRYDAIALFCLFFLRTF